MSDSWPRWPSLTKPRPQQCQGCWWPRPVRLCSQVSSRQFVVFTDYLDAYTRDVSEIYTELDDGSWDVYENCCRWECKRAGLPVWVADRLRWRRDAACLRDVDPSYSPQVRCIETECHENELCTSATKALPVVTITYWTKSAPGQALQLAKVSTDSDTVPVCMSHDSSQVTCRAYNATSPPQSCRNACIEEDSQSSGLAPGLKHYNCSRSCCGK